MRATYSGVRRFRVAFTLVELLVVIGIIALLISILLPSLSVARQQAVKVKCLAQMKELGNAFVMYCNDNKGWLPSCDTCGPLYPQNYTDQNKQNIFPSVSATRTWVGWVDGGPTAAALSNGTLWKYLKNPGVYKCPGDLNEYRNRTYSMNAYLNTGDASWGITNMFKVYKVTQVVNATSAIAFVEEADPRSVNSPTAMANQWNLGGWYQNPLICDNISGLPETTKDSWDDTIASWHRGGSNVAFVDGHAEYFRYADKRTTNFLKNDPTWPSQRYVTPNNPDLIKFRQEICTWNVQRGQ